MSSQQNWIGRAGRVLPAATFGNFDSNIIISKGLGSRVWDEDGKEYTDYLIGSGPMLLGHGNEEVLDAVKKQLPNGLTFFANNSSGIELAEEICRAVTCAEQVRFVSSGSEADMYAIRLARAFTGREKILKFEGGYHGMSSEAQMSLAPIRQVNFPTAVPDSAGIPTSVKDDMIISQFNDLELTASLIDEYGPQIGAIIIEPLQRIIPPKEGFLQGLRALCDKHGILLVFDEIVTGFRLAYGGAQELYGVIPDICTLGKVIGGGFPLAAIAGKKEIMSHFDKSKAGDGFLMQIGTLSGNPVASVAGLKTLEILRRKGQYEHFRKIGTQIQNLFSVALTKAGIDHQVVGDPTLFDVMFTSSEVENYRHTQTVDSDLAARFNKELRVKGIFKAPGKVYPSLVLTEEDLKITENAINDAVKTIQ